MFQEHAQTASGLATLADKHGVSLEAARHMLRALEAGGGTMAQFDHPEFGGMGQWFCGGMVMVGRMNDHALKTRVSALCADLAAALPTQGWRSASASSSQSQSYSSGYGSASTASGSDAWWPDRLGRPASVGAQNATRYAYFPESRRLAVETDGHVALFDTGDHVIAGAAQQQGGTSSFVFSGPNGTISLDALKRVEPGEWDEAGRVEARGRELHPERYEGTRRETPRSGHPTTSAIASPPPREQADPLSVLERLAELHRKGVLTDEEFAGKKADLLARL